MANSLVGYHPANIAAGGRPAVCDICNTNVHSVSYWTKPGVSQYMKVCASCEQGPVAKQARDEQIRNFQRWKEVSDDGNL